MKINREYCKAFLERYAPSLRGPVKRLYITIWSRIFSRKLPHLAQIYGTGKATTQPYAEVYQYHFANRRHKSLRILEIGVGGYIDSQQGGNSLRMWKRYFPKSHIYGFDIEEKRHLSERRITIFKGSQADEHFLKDLVAKAGSFDIIIDDGSHINDHVIFSFNFLFPFLSADGIYAIEDTQTSYWPKYGGDSYNLSRPSTIMGFFKNLADGLNYEEIARNNFSPSYQDKNIKSVHFYHNLVFVYKGQNKDGSKYAQQHCY